MSIKNNGGPAFAAPGSGNYVNKHQEGMALRDWFAGQMAASAIGSAEGIGLASKEGRRQLFEQLAAISYEIADAMIAVREQ